MVKFKLKNYKEKCPKIAGVYVIWSGKSALYVGKTQNTYNRIGQHVSRGGILMSAIQEAMKKSGDGWKEYECWIYTLDDLPVKAESLEHGEAAMILRLNPRLNVAKPFPQFTPNRVFDIHDMNILRMPSWTEACRHAIAYGSYRTKKDILREAREMYDKKFDKIIKCEYKSIYILRMSTEIRFYRSKDEIAKPFAITQFKNNKWVFTELNNVSYPTLQGYIQGLTDAGSYMDEIQSSTE